MKKLLTLALALLALASMAWASISLNSSRSGVYRVVYDEALTPSQADVIVKELSKFGPGVNEAAVRKLLQKTGVNLSLIKKISILGPLNKLETILILTNPANEAQAREIAVSDSGAVNPKPIVVPKK